MASFGWVNTGAAHELDGLSGPPPRESDVPGPPAPPEPAAPDLFDRLALARAAGWILAPEPTPDDREGEAEAHLEEYFDREVMEDRIESGDVDGWYYDLAREMQHNFRPDRGRFERQRMAGMDDLQRIYEYLTRYGRGPERPNDLPGEPPRQLRGEISDPSNRSSDTINGATTVMDQERFDWCNPLNAPVRWYGVVIRVTHNPEGELSAAWVERSSGYPELDRAALESVQEGSVDLAPPPTGVVGERQAIQSDWLFELGVVYVYPLCGAQCVDDPDLGLLCNDDIIRRRLRLLRVVDSTHLTSEERRAERRADEDRISP